MEADDVYDVSDLVIRPATASVTGRVVNEAGGSLAVVTIHAGSKSKPGSSDVLTDRSGRFRIDYLLDDEPLRIAATKRGCERAVRNGVDPGTSNLKIVMRRAGARPVAGP